MIHFQNTQKIYGDTIALKNLNLTIHDGEIFGLIGHNGAGKTTTINLLTSIATPTEGNIFVNGMDLVQNPNNVKPLIAYVPDSPDIFLNLTAYQYWHFIGKVYNIDFNEINRRIEKYAETFDMLSHQFEIIENFSHGMRQKTIIIGALIASAQIWILDEPLTGLDPQASFNLKQMMKHHAQKGNTVLFSTHMLSIAEQLCDRIAILKKGELIFVGSLSELKASHPNKDLETIYLELTGKQSTQEEEKL